MGPWSFVAPCIETSSLKLNEVEKRPRYIGRATAASPATGLFKASLADRGKSLVAMAKWQ